MTLTLTLTQEQLDSLLQEAALGGALLLFCLWVAARALAYFFVDVRNAIREGTPISGEAILSGPELRPVVHDSEQDA